MLEGVIPVNVHVNVIPVNVPVNVGEHVNPKYYLSITSFD